MSLPHCCLAHYIARYQQVKCEAVITCKVSSFCWILVVVLQVSRIMDAWTKKLRNIFQSHQNEWLTWRVARSCFALCGVHPPCCCSLSLPLMVTSFYALKENSISSCFIVVGYSSRFTMSCLHVLCTGYDIPRCPSLATLRHPQLFLNFSQVYVRNIILWFPSGRYRSSFHLLPFLVYLAPDTSWSLASTALSCFPRGTSANSLMGIIHCFGVLCSVQWFIQSSVCGSLLPPLCRLIFHEVPSNMVAAAQFYHYVMRQLVAKRPRKPILSKEPWWLMVTIVIFVLGALIGVNMSHFSSLFDHFIQWEIVKSFVVFIDSIGHFFVHYSFMEPFVPSSLSANFPKSCSLDLISSSTFRHTKAINFLHLCSKIFGSLHYLILLHPPARSSNPFLSECPI